MQDYDIDFRNIIEFAKDVVIVTRAAPLDPPGPEIVYVNPAFTELTGYSYDEVIGRNPRILQGADTDPKTRRLIRDALENFRPVRTTIKNFTRSGEPYWLDISIQPLRNEAGQVTHFVGIERDVTELKDTQAQLAQMARTDMLTGLLNRRAFTTELDREFERLGRSDAPCSVLMIDIDHFKFVNDNYGHPTGDEVLKSFGEICRRMFRKQDSVGRIGGEEFCVILPETAIGRAREVAERLRSSVAAQVLQTEYGRLSVTVSIGVSQVRPTDEEAALVVRRADQAMYHAKANGRNHVAVDEEGSVSLQA